MTTEEGRNRIFNRLCREYKDHGADSWVDWEPLEQELEIPHEQFEEAIRGITNSIDAELSYNHKSIKLASGGRLKCDDLLRKPPASPPLPQRAVARRPYSIK